MTPYDVYKTFKTVESEVKNKNCNILPEDKYDLRMSDKNKDVLYQMARNFDTLYHNVNLAEYIRCGFYLYKSFGYDKMFRANILQEYVSRDSRLKRNVDESIESVLASLKHINKPIDMYLQDKINGESRIIHDYIHNNIGHTVLVYCIWRHLFKPTDVEWEYLNVIQSNYPSFERNVKKYAPMLDKWCKNNRDKQ